MCNATTTNFIIIKCIDYAASRECNITIIGEIIIAMIIILITSRYILDKTQRDG